MGDHLAKADNLVKKAGKKLDRWSPFGITLISPKYEAAAKLYDKAACAFELAESWDRAGDVYVKLASCHVELNKKREAANIFAYAAQCYEKSNDIQKSIFCLERCAESFLKIANLENAARYYKIIAELYEKQENLENAIVCTNKAAYLFQIKDNSGPDTKCMRKLARLTSLLKQYPKAIEIYENLARQSSLFKHGYLLNAGICQLCKGDVVAVHDALKRYLELDSTFYGTYEYKLLANLAAAIDEENITKFTNTIEKYDRFFHLDSWKSTLLMRVKEVLEAKELERDMV